MKGLIILAVRIFAYFISVALLGRALLSWFMMSGNRTVAKTYEFLSFVTDPIVVPCKKLLSRFNTGPIDFSVVLAYFVVNILEMLIVKMITIL